MHKILILNGPNLNMLGIREPEIYGHETLADIKQRCEEAAAALGFGMEFRQTNIEGELIDWIQRARSEEFTDIILNAAAYTHTSVGIHDAIKAVGLPVYEVHISNPHAREPFRHTSYISSVSKGIICGFGSKGYVLALQGIAG